MKRSTVFLKAAKALFKAPRGQGLGCCAAMTTDYSMSQTLDSFELFHAYFPDLERFNSSYVEHWGGRWDVTTDLEPRVWAMLFCYAIALDEEENER